MPRRKQARYAQREPSTIINVNEEEPEQDNHLSQHDATETDDVQPRKRVRWGKDAEKSDDGEEEEEWTEETETSSGAGEKVCMAALCQFGRVACAYYHPVQCTVYVLEDSPEDQHYDLTKALLEQIGPDVVLTSSKADDNFMEVLRDHVDGSGGTFQLRPHKDFLPLKGRDRLLSLRLLSELPVHQDDHETTSDAGTLSEPRNAYDFMRRRRVVGTDPSMQKWNASVRLANYVSVENSPLCLGSIGALLEHLTRARAVAELDDDGIQGLVIHGIEPLPLMNVMQINADALFSLQIFEDENHASIHSDKTKEGLSLFGILNNTKTTLGRMLMREWFLRPSMSLDVIKARHDAVDCFMRPDNITSTNSIHAHLNGTKNVPRILVAMRTGKAKVLDWQGLVKFAFHALLLRDSLSELHHAGGVEIVRKLLQALDVACLKEIGNAVNETIDWEESTNASRVCVRPRIDEELDNLKHVYNGIDTVLSKVALQVSATVPVDYASSLNVVYFPQLGFLICVPMRDEWRTEGGITVLEGWSFQFSSDSHVYFKSQEMHDMDTHIGDLHSDIVDREIEIVQALQDRILVHDKAVIRACDECAELDCLISFASASRSYDYRRPYMTQENVIDIKQGRHPLQELVVDTFVPNDVFILGGAGCGAIVDSANDDDSSSSDEDRRYVKNSVIICTGANACGKSIYLKQIALIQYMAQIGWQDFFCFVPAESALLGITDKIFTRVQTRESISKVQSAFMIDLNQVSLALRNSTARSLLILDEFGKGTLPTDGAGLFCGVLKHLLARGSSCPKVVATTHFHDIFHNDLLSPYTLPITFVQMQVLLAIDSDSFVRPSEATPDEDDGESRIAPRDKITYLYKAVNGYSLHSHAITCAEIFGVPRRVTARAQYVSKLLARHEVCQLLDEDMTDEERQDLADAEEVCRRFLAWDLSRTSENDVERSVREGLAAALGGQDI